MANVYPEIRMYSGKAPPQIVPDSVNWHAPPININQGFILSSEVAKYILSRELRVAVLFLYSFLFIFIWVTLNDFCKGSPFVCEQHMIILCKLSGICKLEPFERDH